MHDKAYIIKNDNVNFLFFTLFFSQLKYSLLLLLFYSFKNKFKRICRYAILIFTIKYIILINLIHIFDNWCLNSNFNSS